MQEVNVTRSPITGHIAHVSTHHFQRISRRIMRDYSVTEVRASIMFQGCLDFLTMCSTHKGRQFTPSKEVDDAWHTFLLYSRAYAGFCAALGSRLWHEPNDGHEPHVGGYAMTLQFMREHAIVHDPRLWQPHAMAADSVPDPSTCGSD